MSKLKRIVVFALLLLLTLAGAEENSVRGSHVPAEVSEAYCFYTEDFLMPVMPVDTPPPSPSLGPGDPSSRPNDPNPFILPPPSNVETIYEMTEDEDGFYIYEQVGGVNVRPPSFISNEDYMEWRKNNSIQDHWRARAAGSNEFIENSALAPKFAVNSDAFKDIFGGGSVEIRPNGTALLDLGAEFNRNGNPSLPIRQQRTGNFKFNQNIQLNVVGKIGEKLRLNANWDTQATFDFENQMKLEYTGTEDEILQKIEAGNVSLPLTSSLIQGGQNLFGIKMAMRFGPLTITTIASQQKGKTQSVNATGGAQVTEFRKKAIDYDENRHFFLGHWFRSRYEYALRTRPNVNAPITITRVEAWVTNNNSSSTIDNRNAVGFVDLGETEIPPNLAFPNQQGVVFRNSFSPISSYPDNNANNLKSTLEANADYSDKASVDQALIDNLALENGVDFVKVENMRKLNTNEFRFHPQLGYVSLNSPLQANQVLFVSYEYMLGSNVYQVGDFSLDNGKQANDLNSNVLFLKMVKPGQVRPSYNGDPFPTWDLMMKNIYNIGGYGLTADNFRLEVMFDSRTSAGDIGVLPTGPQKNVPLLQVFGMDTIQNNNQAGPDGIFDYLQDITIIPNKGLVVFPVLEPFGSHLERKLEFEEEEIDKYVFNEMYSSTRQDALNYATDKDRYYVQGSYQGSSSSEISLNSINVAQGSVRVTANGSLLNEGIDYQVDYNIGKVTILNQGILTSGQEIKVDFETNTLFGIETKTLVGTRLDYVVNQDIQFGATMLHLNERPLTNKVNIGDEPLSNLIWGVDGNLRKDSKFITRMVDKLPLLQTSEISSINASGEFAQLVPGHPKSIEVNGEEGIAYVDDFESAKTTFDLTGARAWHYASFPGNNDFNNLFEPNGGWNPALASGYSRGLLAWYSIDPSFYYGNNNEDFPEADLSNHFTRQVTPTEVFPNQTNITGDNLQRTFDLHYIPDERGPYNYETSPSAVDTDGKFINPEDMWAGVQRRTSGNTDFEAANFEFVEFWLLDPFIYDTNGTAEGGEFFLDLGQISEDVVKDNVRNFENGLPGDPTNSASRDTSEWAVYPLTTPPNNAFNNEPDSRVYQDVGLDGLRNEDERTFFEGYLDDLSTNFSNTSGVYQQAENDPSGDNYQYFRGDNWNGQGILNRYLDFNGQDGNTPIDAVQNGFSTQGSPNPDTEDLNLNGTLNTNEEYYEYKMSLRPQDMVVGDNFIVDEIPSEIRLVNGQTQDVKWYQFRIPLQAGVPINNIQNFKAIEFVRMYLKGWSEEVVLRFARFQLVSTTWRTYRDYLGVESDTLIPDPTPGNSFEIGTVNVEQNGNRLPINYILPPGIIRQQQVASPQPGLLQNEQSLVMRACGLGDGDARGAFKLTNYDMRSYQRLKMWVHAENIQGSGQDFEPGELKAFIRVGSDTRSNYYEYEIPLTPSDLNVPNDTFNTWANEFDIDLTALSVAKAKRNEDGWPIINRYEFNDVNGQLLGDGERVFVVGTPKLSEVKTIMIGIRNADDGEGPICAEVWMNELRLVDFNEQAGWAANARASIKLADFATISASGSYMTPGFGSLEQRINNRSRETTAIWDVTGNFNLGKFFPKDWGIQLPLYVTYGERTITPQYNPLEADVLMANYLQSLEQSVVDTVLDALTDHRINKSISLNNIRKVRVPKKGAKPTDKNRTFPWAIENFALSMSYNEVLHTNHRILKNLQTNSRASLAYNYNFNPKPFEPFKKAKKKNLITAFNFYPLPKTLSMTVAGDRRYEENTIRPTANSIPIQATYQKNFTLSRNYNLRWDFTKSLSMNYTASNSGRVDEPFGVLNTNNEDSLWSNVWSVGPQLNDTSGLYQLGKDKQVNFGRNLMFNQNMGLNYVLPFDQFNLTNWISGTASYQGGFNWMAAPDNNLALGNSVGNSQSAQGNVRLNLESLYNKIGFLQKIRQGDEKNKSPGPKPRRPVKKEEPDGEEEVAEADSVEKGPSIFAKIGKGVVKLLTSVSSVNVDYNRNMSTNVSGYLPQTDNFGLDFQHRYEDAVSGNVRQGDLVAPGVPYVFGWQLNTVNELDEPMNFLDTWGNNGWISSDPNLVTPFNATVSENLQARTAITLFKDFKIDLNATRTSSQNYSEIFQYDELSDEWAHNNRLLNGSYSMSYVFIGTAFEKNVAASASFTDMENIRGPISNELADRNPFYNTFLNTAQPTVTMEDGFAQGYGRTSQEVLIPAFRMAYGAGSFKPGADLSAFPAIPLPNWNINYNGLSKIEALKKTFRSVTIRHGYRGTYNVGGFTQNVRYSGNDEGFSSEYFPADVSVAGDTFYNIESQYVVPSVSFSESFSPLAGVNMKFLNGLSANVDLKMSRNVNMSMTNIQLTETRNKDFTIGLAYRNDKFEKTFQLFGKTIDMKNQLNARMDVTLRDAKTRNRRLDNAENSEITGGNFQLIVRPSVDYVVNTKLNIRFYIEHNRNRPAISTSFPSSYTAVGFQVRFTLAN